MSSFRLPLTYQLGAAVAALALVSTMVVRTSSAAFTATTENTNNSWEAGTVTLTDDDSATALFSGLTGLKPGSTEIDCIAVTYGGSLAASVKLYATITGGDGLGDYITMDIDRGTTATFAGDCSTFAETEADIYTGALSSMGTSFAGGHGTWAPAGGSETVAYRFTYTLADNNLAQGKTATATFTWEAQNT